MELMTTALLLTIFGGSIFFIAESQRRYRLATVGLALLSWAAFFAIAWFYQQAF